MRYFFGGSRCYRVLVSVQIQAQISRSEPGFGDLSLDLGYIVFLLFLNRFQPFLALKSSCLFFWGKGVTLLQDIQISALYFDKT